MRILPILCSFWGFLLFPLFTLGQYVHVFPEVTITSMSRTMDGGYFFNGDTMTPSGDRFLFVMKTDNIGTRQWSGSYGVGNGSQMESRGGIQAQSGDYWVPYNIDSLSPGGANHGLFIFDSNSNLLLGLGGVNNGLYERNVAIAEAWSGSRYIVGNETNLSTNETGVWVGLANDSVHLAWKSSINQVGNQFAKDIHSVHGEGARVLMQQQLTPTNMSEVHVVDIDSQGVIQSPVWMYAENGTSLRPSQLVELQNGDWLIVGSQQDATQFTRKGFTMRLDSTGNLLWKQTYEALPTGNTDLVDAVAQPDGSLMLFGHESWTGSLYLVKTTPQGDTVWTRRYTQLYPQAEEFAISIELADNGGVALAADKLGDGLLILADSTGETITSGITGTFFRDDDLDCQLDASEDTLTAYDFIVTITDTLTGATYYANVDSTGTYAAYLPLGTYTVSHSTSLPYHNYVCPAFSPIVLDSSQQVKHVDFPVEFTADCPFNIVDISSPFLRVGDTNQVNVQVCNYGTEDSYPTQLLVTLDSFQTFVSANWLPDSIVGDTVFFDLDTLAIGACQQIRLWVWLDSTVTPGQTHCFEALVTPDTLCGPPIWSGPEIEADAYCEGDSIRFELENKGATMLNARLYVIYIDDVIFMQVPYQLDAGEVFPLMIAADSGKTYRIEAQQAVGYPALLGDDEAIAFVEGCNPLPNGSFSLGWIIPYYNGNSTPFEAINCMENVTSYDPNDKQAQPAGYGPQHFIEANTPIDYQIRFQNTGTDTAFRVVLVDELSPFLDPATLQMGASTHPYTWSLSEEGVLRIRFQPIELPDSTTNPTGSIGSVRFRIQQKPDLPIGTVINNQAAIYFDFNEPIFTNETFHEIGEEYVPLITMLEEAVAATVSVKVYPNPFQTAAKVEVSGQRFTRLSIRLYDLSGRVVHQQQVQGASELTIRPAGLMSGLYLYTLEGDDMPISTGKVEIR